MKYLIFGVGLQIVGMVCMCLDLSLIHALQYGKFSRESFRWGMQVLGKLFNTRMPK